MAAAVKVEVLLEGRATAAVEMEAEAMAVVKVEVAVEMAMEGEPTAALMEAATLEAVLQVVLTEGGAKEERGMQAAWLGGEGREEAH